MSDEAALGSHRPHPFATMSAGMINNEGVNVDLYIPRKCSATNRLIHAKDKAAVQLNIAHVNADGVYMGDYTTMALCGFIRGMGEADGFLDRLWTKHYEENKGEI